MKYQTFRFRNVNVIEKCILENIKLIEWIWALKKL